MAKKRDLKRAINYVCSDLFAETVAASLYGNKHNKDEVDHTLAAIIVLRNDYIKRVSHPQPGMTPRHYYGEIIKGFNAQALEIIEQIKTFG